MPIGVGNHCRDVQGFSLTFEYLKLCALAIDRGWLRACELTVGRLGGHDLGMWAWKVPVGWPSWDTSCPDDPYLQNSLAGTLMDVENWISNVAYRRGSEHFLYDPAHRVRLTDEQATMIDAAFVQKMKALSDGTV